MLRLFRRAVFVTCIITLGLPIQATASAPQMSAQDQADANCLAIVSVAVAVARGEAKPSESTDVAAMISVFTYFLGKLRGRNPSLEIGDVLTAEVYQNLPGLLESETQRCQSEAAEIGAGLKQLGAAPAAPDALN